MISNRCYYALKAVLELSRREGSGPVTIAQIADGQGIPSRFLEAILRQMKQAGLTDSSRGKEGGYFLARASASISVGEVIRLFEGPLVGVAAGGSQTSGSSDEVFAEVWGRAEKALSSVYDAVSFRELADLDQLKRSRFVANYTI